MDRADLEAVIKGMLEGQYREAIRVIGFNVAKGWSQDASADVAQEIRLRCDLRRRDVPFYLEDFVERYKADTTMCSCRSRRGYFDGKGG